MQTQRSSAMDGHPPPSLLPVWLRLMYPVWHPRLHSKYQRPLEMISEKEIEARIRCYSIISYISCSFRSRMNCHKEYCKRWYGGYYSQKTIFHYLPSLHDLLINSIRSNRSRTVSWGDQFWLALHTSFPERRCSRDLHIQCLPANQISLKIFIQNYHHNDQLAIWPRPCMWYSHFLK